jgi:hypothetical protein
MLMAERRSLRRIDETARPRVTIRITGALALAVLAMAAAPGCTSDDGPPTGTEVADAGVDRGAAFDASVNSDDSKTDVPSGDQGGEPQPGLDAAIDASSIPPLDGTPDADAGDGVISEISTNDTDDLDVAHDAGEPADASVADATAADAPDATADSDATIPDDATPIFPNCVYSTYMGGVPFAILDATLTQPSSIGPRCHCSDPYGVVIHRLMCGSLPVYGNVSVPRDSLCNDSTRKIGERMILLLTPYLCVSLPAYAITPRDLSDWDAILAEQIAGHAGGGANDGGDANDGAPTDGDYGDGVADDGKSDADAVD